MEVLRTTFSPIFGQISLRWELADRRSLLLRELPMLAVALIAVGLARILSPSPTLIGTHRELFLPPCTFYALTGIPCPSCGGTTGFALMARGEILTAFRANPFSPILFAIVAGIGLYALFALASHRQLRIEMPERLRNRLISGSILLYLGVGALRALLRILM